MPSDELPITGYLDRFSHRPGERFIAHVSARDATPFRVQLQRVISADPNPAGPGMRLEDLSSHLDIEVEGRRQPIHLGSYARVEPAPAAEAGTARTYTVLAYPGVLNRTQAVIAQADTAHVDHARDRPRGRRGDACVARRIADRRNGNRTQDEPLVSAMGQHRSCGRSGAGRPSAARRRGLGNQRSHRDGPASAVGRHAADRGRACRRTPRPLHRQDRSAACWPAGARPAPKTRRSWRRGISPGVSARRPSPTPARKPATARW